MSVALSAFGAHTFAGTGASAPSPVHRVELLASGPDAAHPIEASLLTYGLTLFELRAPHRATGGASGPLTDITVGPPTMDALAKVNYMGATVGRIANRIDLRPCGGAGFKLPASADAQQRVWPVVGNNVTMPVPPHLHGGAVGFDKKEWTLLRAAGTGAGVAPEVHSLIGAVADVPQPHALAEARAAAVHDFDTAFAATVAAAGDASVAAGALFGLVSPDGDQGYPGAVAVHVAVIADGATGSLWLRYAARSLESSDGGLATIVNLTNHSFFNLGSNGTQSVDSHVLQVNSDHYLPVDDCSIPTGVAQPFVDAAEGESSGGKTATSNAHSAFDFTTPTPIGAPHRITRTHNGYDHCYLLRSGGVVVDATAPATDLPPLAATLTDPEESGRTLRVYTTAPCLQVYSGNYLNGTVPARSRGDQASAEARIAKRGAVCLETQTAPDAVNHPTDPTFQFEKFELLRPGATWRSVTVYRCTL